MEASKIRLTVPEGVDPSRVLGAGDGVLRALELGSRSRGRPWR